MNSTADPGTGTCDVTECTLREAIIAANGTPVADTLAFAIPGTAPFVIVIGTALPPLQGPVTIDGTTQTGYAGTPIVELDGDPTTSIDAHGLDVVSGSATIRGLAIYRFAGNGVTLRTSGNVVEDNYIGTSGAQATGRGNSLQGVAINNHSGNLVSGNLITGNKARGVRVAGPGTGNRITGNRIYGNTALEIDLIPVGVTPNDPGDPDTGPNELQNFPVLTSVSSDGLSTSISGSLNTEPSTAYTLEFFASSACETGGNGPAERFLGATTAATGGGGNATFTASFPVGTSPGDVVTATAADPSGSTSELSACLIVQQPPGQPNVVIVMTDDQTPVSFPSTPSPLPYLQGRVLDPNDHWVRFTKAYVNVPVCCPSRATLLTGQYAHHHGVQGNDEGFRLDEDETLAVWLQREGYATGMFGKYLNGFPFNRPPYKPDGWDRTALFDKEPGYTNYNLIEGSESMPVVVNHYGTGEANYSTDLLAARSVDFIDDYAGAQPFFLYYVPYAPHFPTMPDAQHKNDFDNVRFTPRPANFNEADVSDKPTWIQQLPVRSATAISRVDNERRTASETLRSVDDGIRSIFTALETNGVLDNTIVIFLSDNGNLYFEHRYSGKLSVYEENVRTPLAIRYPPATAKAEAALASNVDLASTIAELTGAVPAIPQDGRSLVPLLTSPAPGDWYAEGLLMEKQRHSGKPTFWAIRTADYKYVELDSNSNDARDPADEIELYDLTADPLELVSQCTGTIGVPECTPASVATQADLAIKLEALRSAPPGG